MMKRTLAILAATVLIAAVFTACVKDKDDASSDPSAPEISASLPAEESGAGLGGDADIEASESNAPEYSIPEDAVNISGFFEEDSAETQSADEGGLAESTAETETDKP